MSKVRIKLGDCIYFGKYAGRKPEDLINGCTTLGQIERLIEYMEWFGERHGIEDEVKELYVKRTKDLSG